MPEPTVWFNPDCSKCRTTYSILSERGIDANYVEYLDQVPTTADLRRVLTMLGTDDARAVARTNEALWAELSLDDADDNDIIEALHEHPTLIERPIVIMGDRAIVARPPERVLDLFEADTTADR